MAHYDYLYENMTVEEIRKEIERKRKYEEKMKVEKSDLLKDKELVSTQTAQNLIEKAITTLEFDIHKEQNEIKKLCKVCKEVKAGKEISRSSLRFYGL